MCVCVCMSETVANEKCMLHFLCCTEPLSIRIFFLTAVKMSCAIVIHRVKCVLIHNSKTANTSLQTEIGGRFAFFSLFDIDLVELR